MKHQKLFAEKAHGSFYITHLKEKNIVSNKKMLSQNDRYNILFTLSGSVEVNVGFQDYMVNAGTLIFVPMGQTYSIISVSRDAEGFLCSFTSDAMIFQSHSHFFSRFDFLKPLGTPYFEIPNTHKQFIFNIFHRLYCECNNHVASASEIINAYLMALFFEINRIPKNDISAPQGRISSLTIQFKDLVLKNIRTEHQVKKYADMLAVTPNHLNKAVKSDTGISPSIWIDKALLLEAKTLISQNTLIIKEIALTLGFEDPSYFGRLFKKYEKITPLYFRKMIEKS